MIHLTQYFSIAKMIRSLDKLDHVCLIPATHTGILAWRIPWTEEPGRLVHGVAKSRTRLQLLSPLILMMSSLTIFSLVACSSQEDFIEDYSTGMEKAMAPHSSTLAWKIPWREEPGRRQSMGLLRVGHD